MKNLRIAICDDNKEYDDEIKHHVETFLYNEKMDFNIDVYYESEKLHNCGISYDIAFLDIEMEPYSGIAIAKELKSINPYITIFIITSYNKYLDDAMDLNVFRYLQKPLDAGRLKAGLEKALQNIDNREIAFKVKYNNKTITLTSNDIVYIEIVGRTTKIVTNSCEYISNNKIDFWQEKLIASFFYRVHKSFIINIKYVSSYQKDCVVLLQKYKIPISYRKQADFKNFFFNYIGDR